MLDRVVAWLYGAYLTVRFVDEYDRFPAVAFPAGVVRLRFSKGARAEVVARGRLVVEPWLGRHGSLLQLDAGSRLEIQADFTIGPGVRIYVGADAELVLGGRNEESASGITADSVVMVRRSVVIEPDCILGWHTFVTDSDWHGHEGGAVTSATRIGRHTWVAHGASVLKGTQLGPGSIVAAGSHVSGAHPPASLLAGSPATIRRADILAWTRELPPDA